MVPMRFTQIKFKKRDWTNMFKYVKEDMNKYLTKFQGSKINDEVKGRHRCIIWEWNLIQRYKYWRKTRLMYAGNERLGPNKFS